MTDNTVVFPTPGQKDRRLLAFESRALSGYEWPYFAISGATERTRVCYALAAGRGMLWP